MTRKIVLPAIIGLLVIALLVAYGLRKYAQRDPVFLTDMPGKPAPGFNLPAIDNNSLGTATSAVTNRIDLNDFRGKLVLLNFWASWCPPCRKEIPALVSIQNRYQNDNFTLVGLAMEEEEPAAQFVSESGINYPVAYGLEAISRIAAAYGNPDGALPYSVLIDPNQTIVAVYPGLISEQRLDAEISSHLSKINSNAATPTAAQTKP